LVYYGDYIIDHIYDLNDFVANNDLLVLKVSQKFKKKDNVTCRSRVIVLSDVYFLLFDPVLENLNLGKLLFWGDIKQLI